VLAWDLITVLGVEGVELRLGSLGTPQSRAAYMEELRAFLRGRESELASEVRERIDLNPLRAFDSADEGTQVVMAEAPKLLDALGDEDRKHFERVRELVDAAGVPYEVDPSMVRGLDYYTRTVFEMHASSLGAQSQVGGGGRYDGLIEQLGGPSTPAMGWAVGVERLALAMADPPEAGRAGVFIVADPERRDAALALAIELRRSGVRADLDLAERSQKGQMKQADRSGARVTAILADGGGATVRDMESGEQSELGAAGLAEALRDAASPDLPGA
jgi:histidyl-tRNA synthetase